MLDSVFERSSDAILQVLQLALDECINLEHNYICTDHMLAALATEYGGIASAALATMKIDEQAISQEVENQVKGKTESELPFSGRPDLSSGLPSVSLPVVSTLGAGTTGVSETRKAYGMSNLTVQALHRAYEYALFFGLSFISPEHLMLGILDARESTAVKIVEELGGNVDFLRRQILHLMAKNLNVSGNSELPGLQACVVNGLRELIDKHYRAVSTLQALSVRSRHPLTSLCPRSEIVHMVCTGYFTDFLLNQIAFRRYLLEETLGDLNVRVGNLDKELIATIVSAAAQSLRGEVRSAIEYMFSSEYRLFSQMLDEAEHDLIGSVVEDIWWAQGEEIALNALFAEALDDHRRKHLLNLQKRRLEITERLNKLRSRLDETIRQCFEKRSVSAS
jgi:Clp amino terminal domain, pathogenicity island component